MTNQSENRRAARKPLNVPAEYSYQAGTWVTAAGEAVTLNLSEHGALIRSKVPLHVLTGDVISVKLGLDHGSVTLDGRVARLVPHDDGSCELGIVFRNLSAEDEYLLVRQLMKKGP